MSDWKAVLRVHLILMRIRILDPHWNKWIRIQVISLRFTEFLLTKKNNFQIFSFIFFAYFYPKTWTIQKWGNSYNLSFFKKSDLGFGVFFFAVWLIFYPLDSDLIGVVIVPLLDQGVHGTSLASWIELNWILKVKKVLTPVSDVFAYSKWLLEIWTLH